MVQYEDMSNWFIKNAQAPDVAIEISPSEQQIFNLLLKINSDNNLGITFRVAGGWVRDKILGKESDDIDIALDKMSGVKFSKFLEKYLNKSPHVIKSNPDQSKHLETVTMNIYGKDVDFVNLRTETYSDSRIPQMEFGTPEQDASRRDLTINALFFNINKNKVEDFTNKGVQDLKTGVLRTPLDPVQTFLDDPLRILRVLRFYGRYPNSKIDENVITAMKNPEVQEALKNKISPERVAEEIRKTLSSFLPTRSIRIMHDTGLFNIIFGVPEMQNFHPFEMEQNTPHHIDNVFEHTLKVMDLLQQAAVSSGVNDEKRYLMLFSALFHDIGKLCPEVIGVKEIINEIDGTIKTHNTYHGHEDVSAKVVESVMNKLRMSNDEIKYVTTLVQEHMMPHKKEDYWTDKNIRKYINKFGEMWVDIFQHAIADSSSKGLTDKVKDDIKRKESIMERFRTMPPPAPKPVLNGSEIMNMFPGLDPKSGFIREINNALMEAQFNNPNLSIQEAVSLVNSLRDDIVAKYKK